MTRIKICGITNVKDARLAAKLGADALGFNFVPESPRFIMPARARAIIAALPPFITTVGVFADETARDVMDICEIVGLDAVQLHGEETPATVHAVNGVRRIKAIRVRDERDIRLCRRYRVEGFLLDTYDPRRRGGTGQIFNWDLAKEAAEFGPIILAGGLNPDNVVEAIETVRPYAVDVASGIETEPGKKDKALMEAFIRNVRSTEESEGESGDKT